MFPGCRSRTTLTISFRITTCSLLAVRATWAGRHGHQINWHDFRYIRVKGMIRQKGLAAAEIGTAYRIFIPWGIFLTSRMRVMLGGQLRTPQRRRARMDVELFFTVDAVSHTYRCWSGLGPFTHDVRMGRWRGSHQEQLL